MEKLEEISAGELRFHTKTHNAVGKLSRKYGGMYVVQEEKR